MAETWIAGSTCRLVHVPWDASYQRVVAFRDSSERDAYFERLDCVINLEIKQQTYIRPNTPLVVDAPYSACFQANYLEVINPVQPVDGSQEEHLFYFIVDTQYASPSTTRLVLQLDVWQTRFVESGRMATGFLERGHWPVYVSANNMEHQTSSRTGLNMKRWCSAPEGIDTGDSYAEDIYAYKTFQDDDMWVLVLSTADLTSDPGTVDNPSLETAHGYNTDHVQIPACAGLVPGDKLMEFMQTIAKFPWVSQNIISMTCVPASMIDTESLEDKPSKLFGTHEGMFYQGFTAPADYATPVGLTISVPGVINESGFTSHWLKGATAPYTMLSMTIHQGNELLLKPQLFGDEDYADVYMLGSVAVPFVRACYFVEGYGETDANAPEWQEYQFKTNSAGTFSQRIYRGTWIDNALWVNNFPQLPTVNNNYLSYLASTTNTRDYQYTSAAWSKSASNAATQNAYEQAQRGLATNSANQQINNELTDQNRAMGAIGSIMSTIGSAASMNPLGTLTSAANGLMQWQSSVNQQNASNATFANNQNLAATNADANRRLSEYMAAGNYQNTIAGIEASVQDAQLTSPSMAGQFGGDGFSMARGLFTLFVKIKTMQPGARKRVADYWKRFGYALNEYMLMPETPHELQVMSRFSYWKVHDLQIECVTANETETEAIRGIFSQGVSVYSDPDQITARNIDNEPIIENYWAEMF